MIIDDCKNRFYSKYDSSDILGQLYKKIGYSTEELHHEMLYIVYKILTADPCSYWSNSVCVEVYNKMEELLNGKESVLKIDEDIFEYFLMGYNSYLQLSEMILDLRSFNISEEIKTRLYRLPTYTSILEGCLSNFLRVIVLLIGQASNKNYENHNTLGKILDVIKSKEYIEIFKNVDINLRNAINHGKVEIKNVNASKRIFFYYVKNHIQECVEMSMYDFDKRIDLAYDTLSGVVLGLALFINNHIELLNIDNTQRKYADFSLLAMKLSMPGVYCKSISNVDNNKQLNIEIEIENTDRRYISEISILMANLVFNEYKEYKSYMFGFSNPRMLTGWIRYTNSEVLSMYNGERTIDDVFKSVVDRNEFVIFDKSIEKINLAESKYFCFPNYIGDNFKINNIKDVRLEERKRLSANLFIGDIKDRDEIIGIINDAIMWLKNVENPPSPKFQVKHGLMEPDSIYINVYRHDLRKDKELYLNNENFICMIDYNLSGKTTVKNGGVFTWIWNKLYHEKIGNIDIAWREKCYFRKSIKVGRNDTCPCGSGKKYKKCCGK